MAIERYTFRCPDRAAGVDLACALRGGPTEQRRHRIGGRLQRSGAGIEVETGACAAADPVVLERQCAFFEYRVARLVGGAAGERDSLRTATSATDRRMRCETGCD
jgi:hypothetical protein